MKIHFFKTVKLVAILIALSFFVSSSAIRPRNLDLFLLIGQSNMAGRGAMNQEEMVSKNIWMIDAVENLVKAKDPLHFDKPAMVGVGPGLAFAQKIIEKGASKKVGLIPCAVGGSGIDQWQEGVLHSQTGIYPYDAMVKRVRAAKKYGKIRGVLWHQGESDSSQDKSEVYQKKLEMFFDKLRKDLALKDTPIIMGELGPFYVEKNSYARTINKVIHTVAASHPNCYVVTSEGLTDKGDSTHFDTVSAGILGQRYAKIFISTIK